MIKYLKFSVVIPLYNKESYIKRSLESVLNQTYEDFEVIIVDDGSIDSGAKIVSEFNDVRIRLIHQENSGVSVARNRGVKEARAEYIAFLDADDEWEPDFLATISTLIKKYPNAALYATSYFIMGQKGKRPSTNYGLNDDSDLTCNIDNYFQVALLNNDPIVCSSAVCILKRVIIDVGGFPVGVRCGEDIGTWAKIAIKHNISYSLKKCAIYHQYDVENNSVGKFYGLKYHFNYKLLLQLDSLESNKCINKYVIKFIYAQATSALANGYNKDAQKLLLYSDNRYFFLRKFILIILSLFH